MSIPINPPAAHGPRDGELPAYVSNGLIGLRVREQPLQAGMTLVSGVAGEHQERRVEAAAPSPYPLAGDIALNGIWCCQSNANLSPLGADRAGGVEAIRRASSTRPGRLLFGPCMSLG